MANIFIVNGTARMATPPPLKYPQQRSRYNITDPLHFHQGDRLHETREYPPLGSCGFAFNCETFDLPTQYPLMFSVIATGGGTAAPAPPPIRPASMGEYRSWICRFSLDRMSDSPHSALLHPTAQASGHKNMMVQETDVHSPFLVSRRLDTQIQQFLHHGKNGDLQLQSHLPAFAAHLPAVQNVRLAITFQLMLESAEQSTAELIEGHSNLLAERRTHLVPHTEACSGDTQDHPQNSLSRPATHVASDFRETQTAIIDRSKSFPCTICGLIFPFAKSLIRHMNIHGPPSPRLTRAAARKRKREARAAPHFSACESPPDVDMLAGDVEAGSNIPSDLILETPFVEFDEQMKQQDALHGPAAGIDRDVDGVGSVAAKITQASLEVALDDPEQQGPMNSSGVVDTATLLARGSNSANATRLDTRGNVIPPSIRGLYHCTQCPHSFTGKGALGNHLRSHLIKRVPVPRPPVSREWKCTDCDRLFTTRQAHTNHLRVHTKKGYPCPKCSKVYPRESDRANHLVSHEDRRAGSCVCGKKFFKLIYLEYHESVCEQHRTFIQSMKAPHPQLGSYLHTPHSQCTQKLSDIRAIQEEPKEATEKGRSDHVRSSVRPKPRKPNLLCSYPEITQDPRRVSELAKDSDRKSVQTSPYLLEIDIDDVSRENTPGSPRR